MKFGRKKRNDCHFFMENWTMVGFIGKLYSCFLVVFVRFSYNVFLKDRLYSTNSDDAIEQMIDIIFTLYRM